MTEYIAVNSNNLITSFVWSGLLDKAKCGELLEIIKMCSVEAVPIEALQKIRQEIEKASHGKWYVGRIDGKTEEVLLLDEVLEIIDKHISGKDQK